MIIIVTKVHMVTMTYVPKMLDIVTQIHPVSRAPKLHVSIFEGCLTLMYIMICQNIYSCFTESSRYDRSVDGWARPHTSSGNVGSSVKQFSNMSAGGGSSSWGGDRKSDAPPPWSRNTTSGSDRYVQVF